MTKKDYILISNNIKKTLDSYDREHCQAQKHAIKDLALGLAQELSKDNPRFDYFKFTEACGANQ